MKYLAYFQPNKELADLILGQDHVALPGSGLHSTLCFFYMEPEKEGCLVSDLSRIQFDPFEVETQGFDEFDEGSLVLKLSRPYGLLWLHKNIVLCVGKYADQGFNDIAKQYFGDNYNPHLTISVLSSGFDRDSKGLSGKKDVISEYGLTKKVGPDWKVVRTFYSRK